MARRANNNPDHLSQACHSVREIIDKLPEHMDVPFARPDKLGNKVNELAGLWKRQRRVRDSSEAPLSARFLSALADFFNWYTESFPSRRELARQIIRDFDVSGRHLPRSVEDQHAARWMELRQFFLDGTHHGSCAIPEFDLRLKEFETFVLGKAAPKTFQIADQIDALIAEGEPDG